MHIRIRFPEKLERIIATQKFSWKLFRDPQKDFWCTIWKCDEFFQPRFLKIVFSCIFYTDLLSILNHCSQYFVSISHNCCYNYLFRCFPYYSEIGDISWYCQCLFLCFREHSETSERLRGSQFSKFLPAAFYYDSRHWLFRR